MNLSNKNIVHVKTDNVEYIQFKRLLEYKNIAHCYTLKSDGQLNFKTENNPIMLKSYENISKELEFTDIIKPMQKHTDNVLTIQGKQELDGVDGLITNIKNVTLATTSADCISLLFYDPNKNVIANVHSGWRGTEKGISKITVEKMMNEFKCNPEDIICCICPSIRRCHFEVDTDVKDIFYNKYSNLPEINDIIKKDHERNKYYIDTVLINKCILKKLGLIEENIIDSNICTVCNSNLLHLYRKAGENSGRNMAIIEIKK